MVMWMSRIQTKIQNKKKKRQLKGFIILVILFLILGIVSVDYALREMLALNEIRAIGYELQEEEVVIYLLGETFYIANERVNEVYLFFQEGYYKIIEKIKNVGVTDIFFEIQHRISTNNKNIVI